MSDEDITAYELESGRWTVAVRKPSKASPTWLQLVAERTGEEGEEKNFEDIAILRAQKKVQWHNMLYKIMAIENNYLWRILVLILIIVNFIQVSYTYIFLRHASNYYFILVCDIIYILDYGMAVTIYFWKDLQVRLINPPRSKAVIICDAFLAFPYSSLYEVIHKRDNSLTFILLRSISFLRLFRLALYFKVKSRSAGINHWKYFIMQYFLYFFLLQHSLACIWYLLACPLNCKTPGGWAKIFLNQQRYPSSPLQWYIMSMYFALINITNSGIGDIVAVGTYEKLISAITMSLGFTLTTGVYIGSLSSQIVNSSLRRELLRNQIVAIKKHCNVIHLSKSKVSQILGYYHILWTKKKGIREATDIELLPQPLQLEICFDVNYCLLHCSLIFQDKPESFLRAVALCMKHEFYQAGEAIYHQHVIKYKMVCVASGVVEVLSDEDNQSPIISFAPGSCIGEASLVLSIPAKATMKAATYTELQVLYRRDFMSLIKLYPEIYASIRSQIMERIADASTYTAKVEEQKDVMTLSLYVSHKRQISEIRKLKDRLNPKTAYDFDASDTFYRKCLPLYRYSDNVKKVTQTQLVLKENFPWILQPETTLTNSWEVLITINTLLIGVLYPFYIVFHGEFPFWLNNICPILEIINLLDIYMVLTTAVVKKDTTIQTFRGILEERLNTAGFYLDVFSAFNIEVFAYIMRDQNHFYYILKLNKLLKMYRVVKFFKRLENRLTTNLVAIRLVKYPLYLILCPYWFGNILYFKSCFRLLCEKTGWFQVQMVQEVQHRLANPCTRNPVIISVYFALVLLSGVGYGDIKPGNVTDAIMVMFGILIGIFIFGYCIAEFSATFTNSLKKKIDFQEALFSLKKFMNDKHMQHGIKTKVLDFFVLQWYYNEGIEIISRQSLFYNATFKIQQDVLMKERMEVITKVAVFRNLHLDFLQLVAIASRIIILPPDVTVTYMGDLSREMYIIQKGYCERRVFDKTDVMGPYADFGASALIYEIPSMMTVRTITHVKLISIDSAGFTKALSMFPAIAHEFKVIAEDPESLELLGAAKERLAQYLSTYESKPAAKKAFVLFRTWWKKSFVNVRAHCRARKEDYHKPFEALGSCHWLKYLLLPVCILPNGSFLKIWVGFRFMVAVVVCLLTPYQFVQAPYNAFLDEALFCMDFVAYADLYVMMLVGYYGEKNQLIVHPFNTAAHYLKGMFTIDFILCFPWEVLVALIDTDHDEGHSKFAHSMSYHVYHCIFRSLRVFQIYRLPEVFHYLANDITKKGDILQVLKFVPFTITFLNFWSCLVILTTCKFYHKSDIADITINGSAQPHGMSEHKVYEYSMFCLRNSWMDKSIYFNNTRILNVYLVALYWCTSTIMGTGFGDITPQYQINVIINMCMIIFGVLFFGYVFASISSHKAGLHSTLSRHQEMLKELVNFMNCENVHRQMQKKIISYNEYLWKRTGGTEPNVILANLHTALLEESVLYMYEATLREIPLFEHAEKSFFRVIGRELRERYFIRGQTVVRAKDVVENLFIIYRGKVEVISSYNEMQTFMGVGGMFGNISAYHKAKCTVTITALRNLDALFISNEMFFSIMKRYPALMAKMETTLKTANTKFYLMPTTLADSDHTFSSGVSAQKTIDTKSDDMPDVSSGAGTTITKSSIGGGLSESICIVFLPHKWCKVAILPDSPVFVVLGYIQVIAAYINSIVTIYQFAFQHHTPVLLTVTIALDLLSMLKVFFEIHKAYIDRYGDYVTDNRKIRRKYFRSRKLRVLDFVANLPVSYAVFFAPLFAKIDWAECYLIFSSTRLVTVLRCYYIIQFYSERSEKLLAKTVFIKITIIFTWLILILHILSCFWYLFACPLTFCYESSWLEYTYKINGMNSSKLENYIICVYYVVNVLTTTGTGDIVPVRKSEVAYVIAIIFSTKFFIGIFIGDITSVLNAYTSSLVNYEYGIEELRDYMHNENVSEHQMEKMWHYVKQLWTRSNGKQIPRLIDHLPYVMRYDLLNEVYGQLLRQTYLFCELEEAFIKQLTVIINHVIFFPGNYIVQHGDSNESMYFIHRGEVDILTVHSNLTETVHDVLHAGEMFGIAQGLYPGVPHYFSFRARTNVDIIYLQLSKLQELLAFFPTAKQIIYQRAHNIYKSN